MRAGVRLGGLALIEFIIIVIVIGVLSTAGLGKYIEFEKIKKDLQGKTAQQIAAEAEQQESIKIISRIKYIRDPRTDRCFACYSNEYGGIISISTVPCEAVPSNLLKTASANYLPVR